jgi:methylmalonyl-CoA mutase
LAFISRSSTEAAKQAIENDVHILGVSLSGRTQNLGPSRCENMVGKGLWSVEVIPSQDYPILFDAGL